MNKKLIIILVAILLVVVGLLIVFNQPEEKCSIYGLPGNWEIKNNELSIYTLENGVRTNSRNGYSFSDDGNTLILGNGQELTKIHVDANYKG